jgi:hypothetical protein
MQVIRSQTQACSSSERKQEELEELDEGSPETKQREELVEENQELRGEVKRLRLMINPHEFSASGTTPSEDGSNPNALMNILDELYRPICTLDVINEDGSRHHLKCLLVTGCTILGPCARPDLV